MPQYVPNASSFQPGQVGGLYHIGLSDGTVSYGYCFQNNGQQSKGIEENVNVQDRAKLIQISSPNLIDRDITSGLPRATQGDFSGGGLQTVFLDPTKYFDSDLEIRTSGYLTLRPAWKRVQLAAGSTGTYQCIAYNNDIFTCWNTANIYNSAGTPFAPGFNCKFVDTDGSLLYVGDGVNNLANFGGSAFNTFVSNAGAFNQMWVVNFGTFGRFLFLSPPLAGGTGIQTLVKYDLSNVGAGQINVPLGSMTEQIVDLCPYQTGLAILTKDSTGGGNADIWYHDGANLTRIARIEQYIPIGIVNCLGNLYITAQSQGAFEAPVLLQVQAGSITTVARFASPIATLTTAGIGEPTATGQYIYFALTNPQINYVTSVSYIAVYDAIAASVSHMGALDANDNPQIVQPRQMAASGRAAAFPMSFGGNTFLQYQTDTNRLAAGNTFAHSGTMVSSRFDFGTPGIPKRFRRIEAVHAPLQTGESVTVTGFVDGDQFHVGQTPQTNTITNSTVGTTLTALPLGTSTNTAVGRTMYLTLALGAGTGSGTDSTTPDVIRVAVEVGGTWIWTFDLDATYNRRLLNGQTDDPQGVTGKDLYFMLRNAWENGTILTLYLAEGLSYQVQIEDMQAKSIAYVDRQQSQIKADMEWLINGLKLKQVA